MLDTYFGNYNTFQKTVIFDFRLGDGGIGDYLKFFMISLLDSIENNTRFFCKKNNTEIEKYILVKNNLLYITSEQITKLRNKTIRRPYDYYSSKKSEDLYKFDISLEEIFYFHNSVKLNVSNILPTVPEDYISIHLRLGDKFLETDKRFVVCKEDERKYNEDNIGTFIENNVGKSILFFCDNNTVKTHLKNKYPEIIITDSSIGHTSLLNTSNKAVLDTITEFYLLSNSDVIFAASRSGFSKMASEFKKVKYLFETES